MTANKRKKNPFLRFGLHHATARTTNQCPLVYKTENLVAYSLGFSRPLITKPTFGYDPETVRLPIIFPKIHINVTFLFTLQKFALPKTFLQATDHVPRICDLHGFLSGRSTR
jgi:hypothetical protein